MCQVVFMVYTNQVKYISHSYNVFLVFYQTGITQVRPRSPLPPKNNKKKQQFNVIPPSKFLDS